MKVSFLLAGLCLFGSAVYAQKLTVNTATEINKLGRIQDLPVYWDRTTVKQVSSHDTTGNNDDGFTQKRKMLSPQLSCVTLL